jgi:Uma2 family endonuclease
MTKAGQELGKMTIAEFEPTWRIRRKVMRLNCSTGCRSSSMIPTRRMNRLHPISAPTWLAMDERGCHTYQEGIMVQASDSSSGRDKFRPDVVVRCGALSDNTFIADPVVIVEVLSPSTSERDRGRKVQFYKELPTVQHIVLAYEDRILVEHHRRTENSWERTMLSTIESVLVLDAVEFRMDLESIYFDVHF